MWISRIRTSRNRSQDCLRPPVPLLRVAALAGLVGIASGCANPGPPRPPSLNLPSPPKDLRAERVGDQVRLTWTTPTETTDDLPVKLPVSAEICRDLRATPAGPVPIAACTVVRRLPVAPGPSTATDPLPASLLEDPLQLLRYHVRVLNVAGHAADPSNIAFAAAGAAPPPVSDLAALPSAAGTRLTWRPLDHPTASVFLERSAPPPPPQPAAGPPATPHVAGKRSPAPPVRLEGAPAGPDRGGLLDLSAQRDATYSYIAWRSRSVVLDGESLILRSPDSSPLTVTVRDTTPPASPLGLAAVADSAAVDLSWEPNAEPDFAGYWIERAPASTASPTSTVTAAQWQRLNPSLLQAPAYRDQAVPAGSFLYRVLAVDLSGNVSPSAAAVVVTVRPSSVP